MTHTVEFYQDDVSLVEVVTTFIQAGLEEEATVITITTERHRRAFCVAFEDSTDVRFQSHVMLYDTEELLSRFMDASSPKKTRFVREVGSLIEKAALMGPVRVFGEMTASLWTQGHRRAAIRLEELWNELATKHNFSLLCAYPLSAFTNQQGKDFRQVCRLHTDVHGIEPLAFPE
jgi:MEDS: MEthanogen/methylotroph, DcmR Sensory domain